MIEKIGFACIVFSVAGVLLFLAAGLATTVSAWTLVLTLPAAVGCICLMLGTAKLM